MNKSRIDAARTGSITRRQLIIGAAAATAFQQLGCASPVPGGNGQSAYSGKSLQVTLTYADIINPNYLYYFLINNSNSQSATYPVPVGSPSPGTGYGNGFATANDGSSGGFTDFVLYTSAKTYTGAQPYQGFALYHVVNGTNVNASNFVGNGSPQIVAPPGANGGNPNQLGFQLDLAQLFDYPNSGNSQQSAIGHAKGLQWIQINAISTNVVPLGNAAAQLKAFDSFGDDSNGVGGYLLANLTTGPGTYADGSGNPYPIAEPAGDVFVTQGTSSLGASNAFPSLDLIHWSVIIGNTGSS